MVEKAMISFMLPKTMKQELENHAWQEGRTISSLLRHIIKGWLGNQHTQVLVDTEKSCQAGESP